MTPLLVLRPEPGASQTLAAAKVLRLEACAMPLFTIEPVAWALPPGDFDALMLTSANAVRQAGAGLAAVRHLPVYAVGEATAAAARQAGLVVAHVGGGDAAALVAAMRVEGVGRALHLVGEVNRGVEDAAIARVVVYRAVPVDRLQPLPAGSIALIHSPAAGSLFARLIDAAGAARDAITVAAISAAAGEAVGRGWAAVAIAPQPTDAALLAVAAKLCEEDASGAHGSR